jgi:hypothetical protein
MLERCKLRTPRCNRRMITCSVCTVTLFTVEFESRNIVSQHCGCGLVRSTIQKQRLMLQAAVSMRWCCANNMASLSPLLVLN